MAEKSTTRRINIWVNGKQVENSFAGVNAAMRKARNELNRMEIGTQEYITQTKKIKQLNGILKDHKVAQGQISSQWQKLKESIKGEAWGNIIAGTVQNAGSSIMNAFRTITDQTAKFEGGMTNVFTLLDDRTVEQFGDELKQGAQNIQEMGFAVDDVTKSLFDTISAGQEAGHSIEFLNEAAILAKGGVTDLSVATDGMTTIMNAYGLSAEEAGNVSAAFFSAQKEGKTTVAELANNIGKAAPIASNLGVSYQELLSATAELTKKGISTSESITYLRSVMASLIKPSGEAQKVLDKYGVATGSVAVKQVGFTTVLEQLNKLMQEHPEEIAKAIPQVEALAAVQSLSGEGLKDYQRILNNVNTDIGENSSLMSAYNKQMESLPNVIAKGKESLNALAVGIGQKLSPTIKQVVQQMTSWKKPIIELIGWLQDNWHAIVSLGKAILVAVASIKAYNIALKANMILTRAQVVTTELLRKAKLAYIFVQAKLTKNTIRAKAAQELLNISMKMNPIGLIVAGITAAVAAFALYYKKAQQVSAQQRILNNVTIEAKKAVAGQKVELEQLIRVARDDNKSKDERIAAIKKLNELSPDYLGNLSLETINTDEAKAATDKYIKSLERKARVIAAQEKLVEIEKKLIAIQDEGKESSAKWYQVALNSILNPSIADRAIANMTDGIKNQNKAIEDLNKQKEALLNLLTDEKSITAEVNKEKKTEINLSKKQTKNTEETISKAKKALEDLAKKIAEFRNKMDMEALSADERELVEIYNKYQEQIDVAEQFMKEDAENADSWRAKRNQLLELRNEEMMQAEQRHNEKKKAEKAKTQKEIEQLLMTSNEREIKEVTDKYTELINRAEKMGIDTVELYKKMQEEIKKLQDGAKVKTDIFGMTDDDWTKLQQNIDYATSLIGNITSIWNSSIERQGYADDALLAKLEENNETKKQQYQSYVDNKVLSEEEAAGMIEQADSQFAAKRRQILTEQAEREKKLRIFEAIIGQASGIVRIWATAGINPIVAAALTAGMVATTAAQIKTIQEQPVPYAKGGYIDRPTVALMGEAGREMVLSNKVLRDPVMGQIAEQMNAWQQGYSAQAPNFAAMSGRTGGNQVQERVVRAVISETELKDYDRDKALRERYINFK